MLAGYECESAAIASNRRKVDTDELENRFTSDFINVSDSSVARNRFLDQLGRGERGYVVGVTAGDELSRRLLEIGFFPGAEVEVLASMWPGEDPLAVRVGGSTFALRRREAALVQIV